MGKLDGKVVFVTGGARGQGRSHAVRLAREGADIIAVDLCEQVPSIEYPMSTTADLDETVRLVEEQDRRIVARQADVRDPASLDAALSAGVAELGRVDIVLANAGIAGFGGVGDMSRSTWQDMVDINLTGVWNTCQAAVPHLRGTGDGGAIVITSSVAGLHAFPGMPHYVSAKTGLVGLVRSLAVELGPERIRVNSVHPTQVDTPMLNNPYVCTGSSARTSRTRGGRTRRRCRRRCTCCRCRGWTRWTCRTRSCSWSPTTPATSPVRTWRSTAGPI